MTDSTPSDEAATAPPAAQDGQHAPKSRIEWTREQSLAWWANVASFVNVGATLAAFVLLVQTLRVTQDTLAVSQRAAEETRRQADIAQEALIASSRPWIMLTDVKPDSFSSDDETGVALRVNMTVKNVGHSPAQNVSVTGRLLIDDFDPPPDQAMMSICQEPRNGSFIIPGQALFPDRDQDIYEGVGYPFVIHAEKVWEARAARINSTRDYNTAIGRPDRVQAWAEELSKFPFYAALNLVGCINYRSPDNTALYQTSFMFSVSAKHGGGLALLGGVRPVSVPPSRTPEDPDILVVHPRRIQRVVPGDQIRLEKPLHSTFVN